MAGRRADILGRLPVVFGLKESEAAAAVGMSATKFRAAVADGRMPHPRRLDGCLSYDVDDLRAAYKALPHTDEAGEIDTWADVA